MDHFFTSVGFTKMAEPEKISRKAGISESMQGNPDAIASNTANPNPSLIDGNTNNFEDFKKGKKLVEKYSWETVALKEFNQLKKILLRN